MENTRKHFSKEDFERYYKLSKRNNLAADELEIKTNFEKHFNECPQCKAEYSILKSAYFEVDEKYRKRNKIRNTALVTMGSAAILYFVVSPGQKSVDNPFIENDSYIKGESQAAVQIDTSQTDNQLADNLNGKNEHEYDIEEIYSEFQSNSDLKDFYAFAESKNINLSESFKDDYIQETQLEEFNLRAVSEMGVIGPPDRVSVTIPITFIWEKQEGRVTIVIKDNTNKKIFEKSIVESSMFALNKELPPGVYYWDFRIDDKVKAKRKFYIF